MTGQVLKVAVAGLGAVGMPVAKWLDAGQPGLRLVAVSAGDKARAEKRVANFKTQPPVLDLPELVASADIVVEALPPEKFFDLAEPTMAAGKILVAVTVTQILDRLDPIETAKKTGARLIVSTGALAAFDAVRAAAHGKIHSLTMVTRKPPKGLLKAPFVIEQGIDLSDLKAPVCLYKGSVRDAALKFPANVNVAVALSLAGPGPDATSYEIWADPAVERNTHRVILDSDATHLDFTIAGVPTEENPATGKLTPLAVMATLEGLVSPFRIGT